MRQIVLDHDGTLTDGRREYAQYLALAREYIKKLSPQVISQFDQAVQAVRANPSNYGWDIDGRRVAPVGDHYLVVRAALGVIDLQNLQQPLYESCYPQLVAFYKKGAASFIQALLHVGSVTIVTNSSTKNVSVKLSTILDPATLAKVKVVGHARKMQIDPAWVGVVPTRPVKLPGFPRPIYLQRLAYYSVLSELCASDFANLTVIGDIGELDLALPDYLGARTFLVPGDLTPTWEQEYWRTGSKRGILSNLHSKTTLAISGMVR